MFVKAHVLPHCTSVQCKQGRNNQPRLSSSVLIQQHSAPQVVSTAQPVCTHSLATAQQCAHQMPLTPKQAHPVHSAHLLMDSSIGPSPIKSTSFGSSWDLHEAAACCSSSSEGTGTAGCSTAGIKPRLLSLEWGVWALAGIGQEWSAACKGVCTTDCNRLAGISLRLPSLDQDLGSRV